MSLEQQGGLKRWDKGVWRGAQAGELELRWVNERPSGRAAQRSPAAQAEAGAGARNVRAVVLVCSSAGEPLNGGWTAGLREGHREAAEGRESVSSIWGVIVEGLWDLWALWGSRD